MGTLKQFVLFPCILTFKRRSNFLYRVNLTNNIRHITSHSVVANMCCFMRTSDTLYTFLKRNFINNSLCYTRRWHCKWGRCSSGMLKTESSRKHSLLIQPWHGTRSKMLQRSAAFQETKKKVSEKVEDFVKKENVLTVPNALCLLRMATTPVLGYLIVQEFYLTSLGIFVFAGCTDIIDGYIARTFPGQQSMIGSFLDPAADKLLVATLFLCLTANGIIPVPLTSLIILRDICLMGAGFYIRYVSLPPPKTLVRYFDVSFATARLAPTGISKINTGIQLSLVAFSLAAPIFGYVDHLFLKLLWGITGVTTVVSAGSYLYCKNTYQLFSSRTKRKK